MSVAIRQYRLRSSVAAVMVGAWWCLVGPSAAGAEIDFYRDVYPILKSNCIACHNKTTHKAALNMESPEAMRKGGDSGEGLIPGNATESPVFRAAAHIGDIEMPPRGNKSGAVNLTPAELALLKAWIDQGARSSSPQARRVVWQTLPSAVLPIYSVAMTRDGRFAACGRANRLFVYDLATRQLIARLTDPGLDRPGSPHGAGAAHTALVQSLAFSPDGTRLASGSFRAVKIWRREDALATSRKGDPKLGAIVSALSADARTLVCADRKGILHLLGAANGQALKVIPTGHKGSISLLSLSPDATKAAAYGADGTLSLWSLTEARRIATRAGFVGVRSLAWARDGAFIATGGDDGIVRIWPLPPGKKTDLVVSKELKGAAGPITALETGIGLVVAAGADGKARLWNAPDFKPVREIAIADAVSLAVSDDGRRLAAGRTDGHVQVWDIADGKAIIDLSGDADTEGRLAALERTAAAQGLEIAFQKQEAGRLEAQNKALDGRLKKTNETIAALRKDLAGKQNEWKQATVAKEAAQKEAAAVADRVARAPAGKPDAALAMMLKQAQDKLMAAIAGESAARAALQAREVHLRDAEVEAQDGAAAQSRNKAAVARTLAAIAKAKDAQDGATANATAIRKSAAAQKLRPLAVRFSTDAQTVAAVMGDGSLRVWTVASGIPLQHGTVGGPTASASLAIGADGVVAASTADGSTGHVGTASHWILERTLGDESTASPFVDRVNTLRFSPDGKTLATGGGEPTRSGDISLWDVATGKLIREWKERHSDAVLGLDFSPDGKRLASGGADRIVRVTDVASGKAVNVFEGHTHHALGVSFRADGRVLATAGADNAVLVWDMVSGERIKKIEGWTKEVTSVQFIGATNQILTSAGDGQVRIVNDGGGQVRALARLPDFLQSAAGADNSRVIVAAGEGSVLRVWDGATGRELAEFGAEASAKTP